jgi:predicted ferric reductase
MIVRKGDFYFSLVLDFLCVFVFAMSFSFPSEAAIFPQISSAVLFVLSGFLMFASLKGKKDIAESAKQEGFQYGSAVLLVIGFVAYALLLNFLGYIITTLALVYYTIYVIGYRNRKWLIVTSLVSVAVTYALFHLILGVPLPVSFITRLIQG